MVQKLNPVAHPYWLQIPTTFHHLYRHSEISHSNMTSEVQVTPDAVVTKFPDQYFKNPFLPKKLAIGRLPRSNSEISSIFCQCYDLSLNAAGAASPSGRRPSAKTNHKTGPRTPPADRRGGRRKPPAPALSADRLS
ncbi:hypothetical protein EVAR_42691_1 [Eumeta japonica]|uniref:Uncharacterized protein n=1 Tax=Eumeta variegata TaxID=151549 RepID=A0A4C1X2A0_EUMVA|nr:hypothetical protein EVAR_42691_1 [Eumeta japonica]